MMRSPRPHKYRATPTKVDGITFDSRRESVVYAELKLRERAGEISNLELQPRFPIVIDGEPVRAMPNKLGHRGRPLVYRADFAFFEGGKRRVVDVKSPATSTEADKLRRAIVQHIYHVEIEVVR